ncbi:MAG TPA: GntR family transcriptional regulator, partial [Capsulimonadaceae bacterium]|nr:GntR family transcriptional regulator [Capsulimonadaceae bacterium]
MKKTPSARHTQFSSPAYRRIQMDLRAKIRRGVWPVGAMLPSRKHLANEYGVSVPTVERAVSDLLVDGTLRADGGRGTFVAVRPTEAPSLSFETMSPEPTMVSNVLGGRSQLTAPAQPTATWTIGIISFLEHMDTAGRSVEHWKDIIINSVERSVTGAGGSTVFYNLRQPDGTHNSLEGAVRELLMTGVKAIVVVFESDQDEIARATSSLEVAQVPVVFIHSSEIIAPVLSVYYDNRQAGYQAALHLLQRGCRSLLFFAPYTANWVLHRAAGAREAVLWSGQPEDTLRVFIDSEPMESVLARHDHSVAAYDLAHPLIAEGGLADGVIAANDRVAYGFINAATEAGLTMGRNYALVGFDDNPESRHLGLTSLRPPLAALGEEAGKLVLRALQGEKTGIRV